MTMINVIIYFDAHFHLMSTHTNNPWLPPWALTTPPPPFSNTRTRCHVDSDMATTWWWWVSMPTSLSWTPTSTTQNHKCEHSQPLPLFFLNTRTRCYVTNSDMATKWWQSILSSILRPTSMSWAPTPTTHNHHHEHSQPLPFPHFLTPEPGAMMMTGLNTPFQVRTAPQLNKVACKPTCCLVCSYEKPQSQMRQQEFNMPIPSPQNQMRWCVRTPPPCCKYFL